MAKVKYKRLPTFDDELAGLPSREQYWLQTLPPETLYNRHHHSVGLRIALPNDTSDDGQAALALVIISVGIGWWMPGMSEP